MIVSSSVIFFLGPIMAGFAVLMLIPCIVSWQTGSENLSAFLISELITVLAAILLSVAPRNAHRGLRIREMFLLTTLSWVSLCALGALPFLLSHTVGSATDAIFEAVSGLTTTGATVLTGLDTMPRDILLWRSILQWIGGLGIIAFGAAVLPFLRIGGMRLFRTESSDLSDKALPKTEHLLFRLLIAYGILSTGCTLAYWLAGMSLFDAINHAMTTVSTGGFSTHELSIAYFKSGLVESIAVLFMMLAAVPFVLYLHVSLKSIGLLFRDEQVRTMIGAYLLVAAICAVWWVSNDDVQLFYAVRQSLFSVVSIATTTGYVSADYTSWGAFAVTVFFFITFVGGCSGSTSGGIKIFRFQIAFLMLTESIQRLVHPNITFSRRFNGQLLTDDIIASVMAFALTFALTVAFAAMLLATLGNDFITSFSAAATAAANVGPGFGDVIGPTENFAALSAPSKWVISIVMLLGRLELFTVLVLLTPAFWRQ